MRGYKKCSLFSSETIEIAPVGQIKAHNPQPVQFLISLIVFFILFNLYNSIIID